MRRRAKPWVSGIILAAGRSERFGSEPKQLALFKGEPLVRHAVRAAIASSLDDVVIVLGHRKDEILAAIADLEIRVVVNPRHAEGQSTSIQAGLREVDPESDAVMMIMADQPLLTTRLLDRLLAPYRETKPPAVQPTHQGRRGSPVILDRSLFGDLLSLSGDQGGRTILQQRRDTVADVEIENPSCLEDIDTPDDLAQLESRLDAQP